MVESYSSVRSVWDAAPLHGVAVGVVVAMAIALLVLAPGSSVVSTADADRDTVPTFASQSFDTHARSIR